MTLASLLLLSAAPSVFAQASTAPQDNRGVAALERGTVTRYDAASGVVVLDDGRMYRVGPTTRVLVDDRPVEVRSLAPGTVVVIRSGEPVAYRDGQYVAIAPSTAAVPTVVVSQPGTVAAVPSARHRMYGQVTDVDRDGEITVKTGDGEIEFRVSPDAARTIKKGDTVTLDVTIAPPGTSPSASPPTR
jgi:hypothetical protein